MYLRKLIPSVIFLCLAAAASCEGKGEEDEAAIKKKVKSYQEAFNQKDAKALAALWSENAKYVDAQSGETVVGREAIENQFRSNFKDNPNVQLEVLVDTIQFKRHNEAVETGTALIKENGKLIDETAYRAYYQKQNGDWLITQIREVSIDTPPTQYEHLKGFDWLVGQWVDQDQDVKVLTEYKWDKYKNFLTQKFFVFIEGKFVLEGRQIIGWDPAKEEIRSWIFDSDGGFGQGTWKQKGNRWIVESVQTLADGSIASSINIYTPIDKDSYKWESTDREIGGNLQPNIGPVTVKRKKE